MRVYKINFVKNMQNLFGEKNNHIVHAAELAYYPDN